MKEIYAWEAVSTCSDELTTLLTINIYCNNNINTRWTKKEKIYDATNVIENYFVSIVDSDVSALHSYVTYDTVAFVPILTLRQVL